MATYDAVDATGVAAAREPMAGATVARPVEMGRAEIIHAVDWIRGATIDAICAAGFGRGEARELKHFVVNMGRIQMIAARLAGQS